MQTTNEKKEKRTKRRGNGEGSIYQRSDGRWVASVVIGRDQSGKMLRKVVYGWTKTEVQNKLAKLLPQQQAGTLGQADRVTVGEYIDQWLENSVRPNRRASTHASYEQIAKFHIKPFVGGLQLAKLLPANVSTLYATLERDGRSARLRQMAHAVLHRALEVAVKAGMIPRNVCDAVERPRAPKKEIQPLTLEQAQAFLKAAEGSPLHAMYILAIDSGLRQGELNGLEWDDIDLKAGTVTVRRTVMYLGNEVVINPPKTAKGARLVPICPATVAALRDHKARMWRAGFVEDKRVFLSRAGKYLRRNCLQKSLHAILTKAGLPIVKFHALRHTCASLLLQQNTHAKVVQERLGHSQIGITLDTYSHVAPTMQQAAAATMQGLLKATGS